MNSESRVDATLVGVAFGSHEGPSQSPGKIWPKQASAKDPVTLYFKGCLSVVVTSVNDWFFVLSKGGLGLWASLLAVAQERGSSCLHICSSDPGEERKWQKESWQAIGKGDTHFHLEYYWHQIWGGYRYGKIWASRAKDFPTKVFQYIQGRQYWVKGLALEMKRNLVSWLSISFYTPNSLGTV